MGVPREATVESLRRLSDNGLIVLPNRPAAAVPAPTAKTKTKTKSEADELPRPTWKIPFDSFQPDPFLMAAASALPAELRRLLLYYRENMESVTYFEVLLVTPEANAQVIKSAC